MFRNTSHRDNTIPSAIWEIAKNRLKNAEERFSKRFNDEIMPSNSKQSGGVALMQFNYDVTRGTWAVGSIIREKNLFFEYHLAEDRNEISYNFISVKFSNGRKDEMTDAVTTNRKLPATLSHTTVSSQGSGNTSEADRAREKFLSRGITSPLGDSFNLLGCSNSQVRSFSYIFKRSLSVFDNEQYIITKILPDLKEIEKEKGVDKRIKYAGLLFSGLRFCADLPEETVVREIASIENDDYDFTDGPGLISLRLAKKISREAGLSDPVPSIFQIRYGGNIKLLDGDIVPYLCKGVLLVDPTDDTSFRISLRKSMLKVKISKESNWVPSMTRKLGIVDFSTKKVGKLNEQMVCLLSAIIKDDDLLNIQQDHLQHIKNCWHDPFSLTYILSLNSTTSVWESFKDLIHSEQNSYISLVQNRNRYCNLEGKLQVHLGCSRTLFGAVFPEQLHNFLKEGECLVFTERGLLVDSIIVYRSPCYTPGDIRVLQAVDLPPRSPLRCLRNCILFGTQGDRPEPDKMGGGDMDGDQFLVVWDKRLTRYASDLQLEEMGDYRVRSEKVKSRGNWISFLAKQDTKMLGIVDSAFYATAREKGIKSQEAKELNSIFSSVVDKHPHSLKTFERIVGSLHMPGKRTLLDTGELCVWDKMWKRQEEFAGFLLSGRHMPGENDFEVFKKNLRHGHSIADKIKSSPHFRSLMSMEQINEICSDLCKIGVIGEEKKNIIVAFHKNTDRECDDEMIKYYTDLWRKERDDVFSKHFLEWENQRQIILNDIQKEIALRNAQLTKFRADKASRYKLISDKRQSLSGAQRGEKVLLLIQEQNKKNKELADLEEMLGKLVSHREREIKDLHRIREQKNRFLVRTLEKHKYEELEAIETMYNEKNSQKYKCYNDIKEIEDKLMGLSSAIQNTNDKKKGESSSREIREQIERLEMEIENIDDNMKDFLHGEYQEQIKNDAEKLRYKMMKLEAIMENSDSSNTTNTETHTYSRLLCTGKNLNDLRKQIASIDAKMKDIYSPERLEKFETHLEKHNSIYQSLNISIYHINTVIKNAEERLKQLSCKGRLKSNIKEIYDEISRVCNLERKRFLGIGQNGRMPVYEKRHEVIQALLKNDVVVITAGTGCGKSTQIPQYIADYFQHESKTGSFRVCCTQPRRLAAQSIALRVAEEYDTPIGDLVGYCIGTRYQGDENSAPRTRISERTKIEYVTEGWLLSRLSKTPEKICNYGCIILDEAHERNVETDLLLAFLKCHLKKKDRAPLKVVVMSATINPTLFCDYFGTTSQIHCSGRQFHVEEVYRPNNRKSHNEIIGAIDISHISNILFDEILAKYGTCKNFEKGDVLIFLSGIRQIESCVENINMRAKKEGMEYIVAYPLYRALPEHFKGFAKDPQHRTGLDNVTDGKHTSSRKVICTTNIAETSLTIDGVRFVIDGGYAKIVVYDHLIRSKILIETKISQASARQRKGRAGRTAPGWCYRLYSRNEYTSRNSSERPLILCKSIDDLILYSLKVHGTSLEHLHLLDCPRDEDIAAAKERLLDLFLIENKDGNICLTPAGEFASKLLNILNPMAAKMIMNSLLPDFGCLHRVIKLSALLSCEEEIFTKDTSDANGLKHIEKLAYHSSSDHLQMLAIFETFEVEKKENESDAAILRVWCNDRGLNLNVMNQIHRTVDQCYNEIKNSHLVDGMTDETSEESCDEKVMKVFVSAYFSQIVECIDDECPNELGFVHLSEKYHQQKRIPFYLSTESTLNTFFTESQNTRNQAMEIESIRPITYIAYGTLLAIYGRVDIKDGSIINGIWVKELASKRWIERVNFDPFKPSFYKETISFIGGPLVGEVNTFLENIDNRNVMIKWSEENTSVSIYGPHQQTMKKTRELKFVLEEKRQKIMREDEIIVNVIPERSNTVHVKAILGCGLELKKIINYHASGVSVDWFGSKKRSNNEMARRWAVKIINREKDWPLSIFVNQGNIFVFIETLKKIIPPNIVEFDCDQSGIIRLNFTEKSNRERKRMRTFIDQDQNSTKFGRSGDLTGSAFVERINNATESRRVEILKNFLTDHADKFEPSYVTISDGIVDGKVTGRWQELWKHIGKEWIRDCPFWRCLCQNIESQFRPNPVHITYVPSRAQFEVFAPYGLCQRVKLSLVEKLIEMCSSQYEQYSLLIERSDQKILLEILGKLQTVQLQFSSVHFSTFLCITKDNSSNFQEVPISVDAINKLKELMSRSDTPRCISPINAFSFNRIESEFERIDSIRGKGYRVQKLVIFLQSHCGMEALQHAKKYIEDAFKPQHVKIDSVPTCHMCQGGDVWKLSLCGCFYCRRCFYSLITKMMKNKGRAKCHRCANEVLARDCQSIVIAREQKKKNTEEEQYKLEWDHLVKVCMIRACRDMGQADHKGILVCPDCTTPMTYDIQSHTQSRFLWCRNKECPNKLCTICGGAFFGSMQKEKCHQCYVQPDFDDYDSFCRL